MTRVDLHLHSRFNRPSDAWILRKAHFAQSYSDPETLYQQLRDRGFTHFTLTDHHTLEGCLRLEGRPGVFFSEQVTASFPEDGACVELLIWGLTRGQHSEIQALRRNIYELQAYLHQQGLAHAVAHSFLSSVSRLQVVHVEKLLLLFRHFEVRCGLRAPLINQSAESFLRRLAPQHLQRIAERHDMVPTHDLPWEKVFVGGSDDQSGLSAGRAWTSTPAAQSTAELLLHLREGRCHPGGDSGGALVATHGLFNKVRLYLTERFPCVRNSSPLQNALAKLIEGRDPTQLDWQERWQIVCEGVFLGKFFTLLRPSNAPIRRALGALLSGGGGSREISEKLENVAAPEERFSILMNLFANRLENHLFSSFAQRLNHGNPLQAVQELAMLLPALAPLSAYLLELRCESADRAWFHTLSLAMVGQRIPQFGVPKTAWFTDTLRDINGVSTTIRSLAEAAHTQGIRVTVLSCSNHAPNDGPHYQNFHPVREFTLPEYEQQRLAIPPVLEIVKHISENAFTEVLVSTPGPMGLVGLLVARLLRLPVRGIYHTDFPRYVRILTEDPTLEAITWNYMRWFYTDLDELLVNSDPYRDEWIARGVYPSKIRILPRGVDRTLFHPSRRRVEFWRQYGVPENQKVLLYVGRISREKGLDLLVPMMEILAQQPLTLALVGDGPYAQELRAFLPGAVFTGPLRDLALAEAYASADLFVFPSSTDTFGNVVLEALASGLPCVVSDTGGPAKLVQDGCSGLIAKAGDPGDFSEKITRFLKDSDLIPGLQQRAADSVKNWDWSRAAAHLFVSP